MTSTRNIYPKHGSYHVRIYRQRKAIVVCCKTLGEAIMARDDIEAAHAPLKPWGATKRKKRVRTTQTIRSERLKAGQCVDCGEHREDQQIQRCAACRAYRKAKYKPTSKHRMDA